MKYNFTENSHLSNNEKINNEWDELEMKKAKESLRQETETFNQNKKHNERWFNLKCFMGYASIIMVGILFFVSIFILIFFKQFPSGYVIFSGGTLFGDILLAMLSIWKVILKPNSISKLEPVTKEFVSSHYPLNPH